VDEAQDLTRLQWRTAHKAFANADELWIAGDDDQSIHRWAGADEDYLLGLTYPREVLPASRRLPRAIYDLSQDLVHRISKRFEKPMAPADREGTISWLADPAEVDLAKGSWLMLARTRAQLGELVEIARDQGVVYRVKGRSAIDAEHVRAIQAYEALRVGKRVEGADAATALKAAGVKRLVSEGETYTAAELKFDATPIWHDALIRVPIEDREYYLSCLRRGEKLTAPPRVRIDTIHGVKGAEAENVLLLTDLTPRTAAGFELAPDSEHRVFYVGVTRASHNLFPVAPRGRYEYRI